MPDNKTLLYMSQENRKFLYRRIVGIPRGTNCTPLVAGLFLFCYVNDFVFSLSDNT